MLLVLFMVVGLFANEVKVDGKYSNLLGNPFKSVLETKSQDISIVSNESKLISLTVETNRNDFSFSKPSLEVLNTSCNNVLKSFVSEDFNIVQTASRKISCEILPTTIVKIDYVMKDDKFMDQISDIVIHLAIRVNDNGKVYEDSIDMNKDLNLKGAMKYDIFAIRSELNLDRETMEESIQKIVENAIYSILSKNKKG